MKITVSVIKADIGSIGGHIQPSCQLVEEVRRKVSELGKGLLIDTHVGYTGDDIAILMTHTRGNLDEKVHKLAWDTFLAGTEVAKSQGLYGATCMLPAGFFLGGLVIHGGDPGLGILLVPPGGLLLLLSVFGIARRLPRP